MNDVLDLLANGKNDAVIDRLCTTDTLNDDNSCALLARAYFQRGDSKGDVYTSHYFARRARQLGNDDLEIAAIQALSAFRKEQFSETVDIFSTFVTEQSPASVRLIYGLALHRCAKPWDAMIWINSALRDLPESDPLTALARQICREACNESEPMALTPGVHDMFTTVIDTLKASQIKDIEAPFRYNALSKLRGLAAAPKDFKWVEKNIPCQAACPAGTDIPGYLSAVYKGEYDEAYRINLRDNVFPAVLGRVCARPCEAACRHGLDGLGEPVAICWSKRSAADFHARKPVILDKLGAPTGNKVAVIGAGVAGLTVARNLALLGHQVTVFEKHSKSGGMMIQGIPEFRLPRDIIDLEIEQVRRVGVNILCNTEIGRDNSLQALIEDYHALIMAAGTLRPNRPRLPGMDLRGIHHGLNFLLELNQTQHATGLGHEVLVIGGGFTAMDCARSAWRLGAGKVRVMYRRGQEQMQITPGELDELRREGMAMEFFVSPIAYLGDEVGRLAAVRFIRTRPGEPDASGRRRPVEIPGSEFEVACDTVLLATGQFPDTEWIDDAFRDLLVRENGWLKSGDSQLTEHAKIFAAGDFATGARSLIDAIGHAKECARRVDRFLTGKQHLVEAVEVEDAPRGSGRIREMDAVPLQPMPCLPTTERTLSTEVETGYTQGGSVEEAQRCYLCHYKYEIDVERCIFCEWCLQAKPRPDCIVKAKALRYDADGGINGFVRAQTTEETHMIYINQQDCIRCNACVQACPVDCISVQKVSRVTFFKAETELRKLD